MLLRVLADLTHIPIDILNTSEFIGGELPKEILTEKGKSSDVIVRVENKNKIIIEANRQYSTNLFEKNASYVFKNSYMESNIGQNEYQSIFIVNVDNFNHYHTKRPILTFKPTDEEGHIEHGLYTSFHLVLENFDNPQYTISERVRKFMEFMGNKPDTISNLKEKYKDGDIMAFAKKAEELSKDTRFINYYNIEEMHEAEKQDFYNTGREDGEKEGRQEEKIMIAKNMLDLDIDIDKIVKATGLSEEEINNLKDTSKEE